MWTSIARLIDEQNKTKTHTQTHTEREYLLRTGLKSTNPVKMVFKSHIMALKWKATTDKFGNKNGWKWKPFPEMVIDFCISAADGRPHFSWQFSMENASNFIWTFEMGWFQRGNHMMRSVDCEKWHRSENKQYRWRHQCLNMYPITAWWSTIGHQMKK